MAARKRKPVEANDGSYGGMVLAAWDKSETTDGVLTSTIARAEAAEAEVVRLRKALEQLSLIADHIFDISTGACCSRCPACYAKAALEPTPGSARDRVNKALHILSKLNTAWDCMDARNENRELSSYAFNNYGSDAKLYNGIHDLETEVQRLREAAQENRTK